MTQTTTASSSPAPESGVAKVGWPGARRLVLPLAVCAVAGALAAAVMYFLGESDAVEVRPGEPVVVTAGALREFAASGDGSVHWLGTSPGKKLELTETTDAATYVRYLPDDVEAGDPRPAFTTVATYPMEGAFAEATRPVEADGRRSDALPDGGTAAWDPQRP